MQNNLGIQREGGQTSLAYSPRKYTLEKTKNHVYEVEKERNHLINNNKKSEKVEKFQA